MMEAHRPVASQLATGYTALQARRCRAGGKSMIQSSEEIPEPARPAAAPVEYAGQWVAWNRARTEIVAHGKKMSEVLEAAVRAGHLDAILQKVRRPDSSFIGAR
jgi:hypothetical protein